MWFSWCTANFSLLIFCCGFLRCFLSWILACGFPFFVGFFFCLFVLAWLSSHDNAILIKLVWRCFFSYLYIYIYIYIYIYFFFFQDLRMSGINPSLNIWKNSPMKLSSSGISLLGGFEYWLNVLNHYWSDQVFYYFMIHSLYVICFLEVIQLSIQSSLLWLFFYFCGINFNVSFFRIYCIFSNFSWSS